MKILAIDTSSKLCGVALLENYNLIDKIVLNEGLTHSEILLPSIEKILYENNLKISDMDLFVCDVGPGSFTGIRIGIATLKAFSDSLNIPAIGVNSLECLAHNVSSSSIICSIIDCKNDNCYFALYELKDSVYKILELPQANSIQNCLSILNNKYSNAQIVFVGDGSVAYKNTIEKDFSNCQFVNSSDNDLDVTKLGLIGLEKYYNGLTDNSNNYLLPLYLKKPQAQKQLESNTIQISKMQLEDIDSIDYNYFDDFWNVQNLKDDFLSSNSVWFLAKIEEKIVGFVGIKVILDEADIMNIAIHKNYRQQGFGSLLLTHIINYCKNNNVKKINLEVNENNIPAINLYKKQGFKIVGVRKKYYENDDAILMCISL